jgi:hypothetical protein
LSTLEAHVTPEQDASQPATTPLDENVEGWSTTLVPELLEHARNLNEHEVIAVTAGNVPVSARDVLSLGTGEWMTDTMIEASMEVIGAARQAELQGADPAADARTRIGTEAAGGMPRPVPPNCMRIMLDRSRRGPTQTAAVLKAVTDRLNTLAKGAGGSNEATVSVVSTGGGHWVTMKSSLRERAITMYCPMQDGREYAEIGALWQQVMRILHGGEPFAIAYYVAGDSVDSVAAGGTAGGGPIDGQPAAARGGGDGRGCNCGPNSLQAAQCWLGGVPLGFDAAAPEKANQMRRALQALVMGKAEGGKLKSSGPWRRQGAPEDTDACREGVTEGGGDATSGNAAGDASAGGAAGGDAVAAASTAAADTAAAVAAEAGATASTSRQTNRSTAQEAAARVADSAPAAGPPVGPGPAVALRPRQHQHQPPPAATVATADKLKFEHWQRQLDLERDKRPAEASEAADAAAAPSPPPQPVPLSPPVLGWRIRTSAVL